MGNCKCSGNCSCKKTAKTIRLEEQLNRMKYLNSFGKLQEANYSLTSSMDEDDEMPEDAILNKEDNPEEENQGDDKDIDVPNIDNDQIDDSNQEIPSEPPVDGGQEGIETNPMNNQAPPNIEDVQNKIIKSSVSAMQNITSQIDSLDFQMKRFEDVINQFENRMKNLSVDVEEVREPTNTEKLDKRKDDSYPYYFNLKNMWSNKINNNDRSEETGDDNIIKLEDGSYIADYDTLPKFSERDIENSFNR